MAGSKLRKVKRDAQAARPAARAADDVAPRPLPPAKPRQPAKSSAPSPRVASPNGSKPPVRHEPKLAAAANTQKVAEQREEQHEEAVAVSLGARLFQGMPGWAVSLLLHVLVLMLLALVTFAPKLDVAQMDIFTSSFEAEEFEPLQDPVEFEPLEEPFEVAESSALEASVVDAGALEIADFTSTAPAEVGDFSEMDVGIPLDAIGFSTLGDEIGSTAVGDMLGKNAMLPAKFFGSESKGQKFVFVVDNSNSMSGGRFETALIELVKAIDRMTPQQQIYIVFFSDTAYGLFHPDTASALIPATDANKARLKKWLPTVELCLNTNCEAAMRTAVALQPDVIYVLGDGAFTDNTEALMTGALKGKATIHTLGMMAQGKGDAQFTAIAKANNGTYKDVGVLPEAVELARKHPIPKNSTRGSVWGLKLPVAGAVGKQKKK